MAVSRASVEPEAVRLERQRRLWAIRAATDAAALAGWIGHGDGRLREAAVVRLGELGDTAGLAWLPARLNDWVPAVRAAARQALQCFLQPAQLPALVRLLPAFGHLRACGRYGVDHGELLAALDTALRTLDGGRAVCAGLDDPDPRVVRACFRLCRQAALLPLPMLVGVGLRSSDPCVAGPALDALRSLPAAEQTPLLTAALRAPFMPVRREALQRLLATATPAAAVELALARLLDRAAGVRQVALRYLLDHGARDAALAHGRAALATPLAARAVGLLGGIGAPQDVAPIEALRRTSPLPGLRAACYRALLRLQPERRDALLRLALADPAAVVIRTVGTQLQDFGADALRELLVSARHPAVWRVVLASARRINRWERLRLLLTLPPAAFALPPPLRSADQLADWLARINHSFVQPDRTQRAALASLLPTAALPDCSARLQHELLFTLAAFGLTPPEPARNP